MKLQYVPISEQNDVKALLRHTVSPLVFTFPCSHSYFFSPDPQLLPYYEKRTQSQLPPLPTNSLLPDTSAHTATIGGPNLQGANPSHPRVPATNYTPVRSRAIRGRSLRNSTAHRTADDILGLNTRGNRNQPSNGSLDMEIERYLSDTSTGISSIMYWQVCMLCGWFVFEFNLI